MTSRLRGLVELIALLYLVAVAVLWLLTRGAGDRWWATAMLVYLPRHVLILPVVALAPVLWAASRRFAVGYAIAGCALLLPFAGLHVSLPARALPAPTLRLLSYNIWYGYLGSSGIEREIEAATPDIVLLQALSPQAETFLDAYFSRGGWHTHSTVEFYLASRYPIRSAMETPMADDRLRPPFIQYTLETAIGPLDVFNVHLLSPRAALAALRGSKRHLLSRRPGNPRAEILVNAAMRREQARQLAEAIRRAAHPVVVAGDTNLPEESGVFRDHLGGLRDGFAEVGTGFGYTYPANVWFPWMRLDRILCSDTLEFAGFSVGGGAGSDHYPVRADIGRRRPR